MHETTCFVIEESVLQLITSTITEYSLFVIIFNLRDLSGTRNSRKHP